MTIEISFADLTHTGKTVDANYFPLGSGYVAAYAEEYLEGEINIQLFKYPTDFADYLDKTIPKMAPDFAMGGSLIPAAIKFRSVAGLAAMRSATDMTDGSSGANQALRSRSQTTTWEPPSDRPSSFTRSPETFRMSESMSQSAFGMEVLSKGVRKETYQSHNDVSPIPPRLFLPIYI